MDFSKFKKTQEKVVKLIGNSYKKNRFVHTYLFEGAKGTPKLEAAYYLASVLMCESSDAPCGKCLSCQRIENGSHPRIFLIKPIQDSIKKEQIDALEYEFSRIGLESGRRVFIIEGIDKATLNASNSLLKFLEEMNDDCYGVLITEAIQNVLPTIISRSQVVSFAKIPMEELIEEYKNKGVLDETSKVLATLTNDVSEGLELIKDGKVLDIIDLVKKCNESIILNENPFLTFYENSRFLFEENDKTYHQMFLDILITITNDRIYKILGQDDKIIFSSELEKINDKVELDYKKTFEQLEKILEFKTRLKYNISLEAMYMQMFIEIRR